MTRKLFISFVRTHKLLLFIYVIFSLFYAWISVFRYYNYETGGDLAIYNQIFWFLSKFEWPWQTFHLERPFLSDHLNFIYFLIVPLYDIFPKPETLLILNSVVPLSAVFPLFSIARKVTRSSGFAFVIVLAYCLYPPFMSALLYDFHEIIFVPPLLVLTFAAYLSRRKTLCGIGLALLLIVKEDLGVFVSFFGLYCVLKREWRRFGLLWMCIGILYSLISVYVIIPSFGVEYKYFKEQGQDILGIVYSLLTHPVNFLHGLLDNPVKLNTLIASFRPYVFLPLFSPFGIIMTAEQFIMRFVSVRQPMWTTGYHYSVPLAAILPIATILVANSLRIRFGQNSLRIISLILLVMTVWNLIQNRGFIAGFRDNLAMNPAKLDRIRAYEKAYRYLPQDASVATHTTISAHLSNRKKIYIIDKRDKTEYILFDLSSNQPLYPVESEFGTIEELKADVMDKIDSGIYDMVFSESNVYLVRNGQVSL